MKFAPSILGGVLFFIGFFIALSIDFPSSPSSLFGYAVQDVNDMHRAMRSALWSGVAISFMICGVIVPLVLQWEYSRKGTAV